MEKFLFITHDNLDAYFNLASEEYLLKQKEGYYVYLWQNENSVIIGINQNVYNEVNLDYAEKNNVKIVRRLTGGGAVYHDKFNLNYTIIAPYNENENAYVKFSAPVIEYLNSLGVEAKFSGRNDIIIGDKKISGNAQTVYKNRILHHGTLLFSSNMNALSGALKENKLKIENKGIKSIRARVTNVSEHLDREMTIAEFKNGLAEFFKKNSKSYQFTSKDIAEIERLKREKYSTFEWNIGASPKGKINFIEKFDFGIFNLVFDVEKGKMQNVNLFGDFFCKKDVKGFIEKLEGVEFSKNSLLNAFSNVGEFIVNADCEQIVDRIFK